MHLFNQFIIHINTCWSKQIECKYCHSSARVSKHSGIPSLNVCMNCHEYIAEYNGEEDLENGYTRDFILMKSKNFIPLLDGMKRIKYIQEIQNQLNGLEFITSRFCLLQSCSTCTGCKDRMSNMSWACRRDGNYVSVLAINYGMVY